ncbi:hypothetical protein REPUB_Repub02eG0282700 [Reevesia pubescens]
MNSLQHIEDYTGFLEQMSASEFQLLSDQICSRIYYASCKCGKMCINFDCKFFMEMFQEVAESQGKKEENKDAMATADLLEKLNVGESTSDEKEREEKATASEDKEEAVEDKAKTEEEDKKDKPASKA